MPRPVDITDPAIAKALAHPLRRRLLALLEQGEFSASDLAAEVGEPLPNVSYHVRALARLGLIEPTRTELRRGFRAQYYRAAGLTYFPGATMAELPVVARNSLVLSWYERVRGELEGALASGALAEPEAQALRATLKLDGKALQILGRDMERLHRRGLELETLARARSDQLVDVVSIQVLFEKRAPDAR